MTSGRTVGRVRAGTDGRDKEDGDRVKDRGREAEAEWESNR